MNSRLFLFLRKYCIFRPHVRLNVQTDISCSVGLYNRATGWEDGKQQEPKLLLQRCRSQRQIEASSHTAIKMLLSRLKLVCRMADVHLGRVSVVHLETREETVWHFFTRHFHKCSLGKIHTCWLQSIKCGRHFTLSLTPQTYKHASRHSRLFTLAEMMTSHRFLWSLKRCVMITHQYLADYHHQWQKECSGCQWGLKPTKINKWTYFALCGSSTSRSHT